jgi:LysR family transcriptional regulator, low CO2-responsive transcriptional regulator
VTLTQLSAFVLVARLGSVRAAADILGVSEPAVSQALAALRAHLGDKLIVREGNTMALTQGGNRLFGLAAQMVALGAEAEAAVRDAKGAPAQLRVVVTSVIAEFVATPLLEAFGQRSAGAIEASSGVATTDEMRALVPNRLADVALGPYLKAPAGADSGKLHRLGGDSEPAMLSEPVLRYQLVAVAAPGSRPGGRASQWPWLVDPSGTDPDSDVRRLLARLRVPESRIRVFPNQTAAWAAAADGAGVAPAVATLVSRQLRRGELQVVGTEATPADARWHVTTLGADRRTAAARTFRTFLSTPLAMQLMCAPGSGVPPSRFRPPVYVTIWS